MWLEHLGLALREIRRNLLRSFLTILGIVIGVAAVITMVTVGRGATQAVSDQITSLGTNLLMVRPGQRLGPGRDAAGSPPFRQADAEAIAAQISGVRRRGAAGLDRRGGGLRRTQLVDRGLRHHQRLFRDQQLDPRRGPAVRGSRAARRLGRVRHRRHRAARTLRRRGTGGGRGCGCATSAARSSACCRARARAAWARTRTTWS